MVRDAQRQTAGSVKRFVIRHPHCAPSRLSRTDEIVTTTTTSSTRTTIDTIARPTSLDRGTQRSICPDGQGRCYSRDCAGGTVATLERFGPMGHDLVVLDGSGARLSVGTSSDNDLVIDGDMAVSRVHLMLERVGPAWCVTDVGSTNGTMVNGERHFGTHTLFDRDEIVIGRTRLVMRDPA